MPPPAHTILDNSGIVMPPPYAETSRFSQTIYDQQQQLFPTEQFIPQPQYMPQPIPSMVQPMHQSTRIIIQQGEGIGGSRVIINQDAPSEHVNLFNQPTYQPAGEMRFVESSIGGNAMHNSIGQYPQGPIMTSNFPGMGGSIVAAQTIPPQIDPNTFGVNASQSSIYQMDHSVSSLAHPPMDVMIPPGRMMPQETTLVTQQNFMQPVQESRISNKSLRTIGGPGGMVVQTTTEEVIQQPPIVLDSRIRQTGLNSSLQQGIVVPPPLPAPIINSAYNPNPINTLEPSPGSFGPIVEESRSALGNGMFVSHLQPQGFPLAQNQQQ